MARWLFHAGGSILLAAQFVDAQLATPTLNGNLSITATRTNGPTATGGSCCVVAPVNVGLNFYYTDVLTATVATVLTQVYEYNNTRITSTTTISSNKTLDDVSIPQSIIPGTFIYSRTVVGTETAITLPNTVVASPTPFVEVLQVGVIFGTWSQGTAGIRCASTSGIVPPLQLETPFAYVEDPPTVRTTPVAYANPAPSGLIDFWISNEPTITDKIPGLKTCTIPSGSGEPTVHVPVTALTQHATSTIKMNGGGPDPSISSTTKIPVEPVTTQGPTTTETHSSPNPNPNPTSPPQPPPINPPPSNPPPSNPPPSNPPPSNPPSSNPPSSNPPSNLPPNPPLDNPSSDSPLSPPSNPKSSPPSNPPSNNPPSNNPPSNNPPSNNPPSSNPQNNPQNNSPNNPLPLSLIPLPLPSAPAPTTSPGSPPAPNSPAQPPAVLLPNGETLLPGSTTTLSSHTLSIPTAPVSPLSNNSPAPALVVLDGTTVTLAPSSAGVVPPVVPVSVGSGVLSATPAPSGSGLVLPDGATLSMGASTVVSGETIVLTTGTGGVSVVQVANGTSTGTVFVPTWTQTGAVASGTGSGSWSTTGVGTGSGSGGPSPTTSSGPEEFSSAAEEVVPWGRAAVGVAVGAAAILGL